MIKYGVRDVRTLFGYKVRNMVLGLSAHSY